MSLTVVVGEAGARSCFGDKEQWARPVAECRNSRKAQLEPGALRRRESGSRVTR
jgi:hypothetical protein